MCYNNTYLFYTYKGYEYGNIKNKFGKLLWNRWF